MSHFDSYLRQLMVIVKWAAVQDNLNRFQEKCLRGTAHWHLRHLLSKKMPSLAEWRWGTLKGILEHLREMLGLLRLSWNYARYTAGEGSDAPAEDVGVDGRQAKPERDGTNLHEL
eukprot:107295-Alexandrium_andersonii.AAC.1